MKCFECGTEMTVSRQTHRYRECGLSNVILADVEVRHCPACGEQEVAIPRVEEVHRAIARALTKKPSRLAPEEIRFLRKSLGWSGADFARKMDVTPETVSRWECGQKPMSGMADRLLRLMVVKEQPVKDYSLDLFEEISPELMDLPPLKLEERNGAWVC